MTAGTAAKPFRTFGWHTYSWSTYYPPVDTTVVLPGGVWNAFNVTVDPAPDVLDGSGKTNFNGTVSVVYGLRPGAYTARSLPIPVQAGVTFNYRLANLQRKKTYYVNAYANVQATNAGGVPQAALVQYGELSASTS